MHTLQRDMTVPPFSFSIQVAQHYIQPRRRLCLFFGKSTLPFFCCFFFLALFPIYSSFFILLPTFLLSFILFFLFSRGLGIHKEWRDSFDSSFHILPANVVLLLLLVMFADSFTWAVSSYGSDLAPVPHTHTHNETTSQKIHSRHNNLGDFFFAGEGGGVIYVDLIWIIYTVRVSGAHIISICVLALLRYP